MKNGKGKGPEGDNNIIKGRFCPSIDSDKLAVHNFNERLKHISDLLHEALSRPSQLSGGSSIPPRSTDTPTEFNGAKIINFNNEVRKRKRTTQKNRRTRRVEPQLKFNDLLIRESKMPVIDSITGGTRQQINRKNMAEEDARAKKEGYAGVRKVYLLIQNTLPDRGISYIENFDPDSRASNMAEKIKTAVQELEKFYSLRDEDDEPVSTDNPADPRLFNIVASVLIRVWGHNCLTKLNDQRVNSIVMLLNQGDVSWRKLIDLMVEWEKGPSVSRQTNRYNR